MPVCLHLDRLLHKRRMSLAELADRTGVSASDLAILKSGDARALRFTTLEALCRELGCQPGDILTYAPDGPTPPDAPA